MSSDSARARQARSFGSAANAYNEGRPGYPLEAVEWLLPPQAHRVADIGAGTGKLSAILSASGREVVAVDPDPKMLEMLSRNLPAVQTLTGQGENIPLPDESVDAVTFGQSWHWVDPEKAVPEVWRVLTPGGVLGLFWNIRDNSVPWVRELTGIMQRSTGEILIGEGGPVLPAPLNELEHHEWPWVQEITPDQVIAMITSRSNIITAPESERAQILKEARELLDSHPQTRGKDTIELPYVTHVFRARKTA